MKPPRRWRDKSKPGFTPSRAPGGGVLISKVMNLHKLSVAQKTLPVEPRTAVLLDSASFTRMQPRKRTKPTVTIAIGFACKGALVLASDSQMSAGDKFKRYDEPKLFPVKFANDTCAIIAISGQLDPAARFREVFQEKASAVTPGRTRDIADVMEESLRETRSRFLKYVAGDGMTNDERSRHLDLLDFEVILAYYHGLHPCLYHSSFFHGNAIPCRGTFEAIGCGTDVASFILTGANLPDIDDGEAMGLAYFAVETCKKYDKACGGSFQHLVLKQENPSNPAAFIPELMQVYQHVYERSETLIQRAIAQSLADTFREIWKHGVDEADSQEETAT